MNASDFEEPKVKVQGRKYAGNGSLKVEAVCPFDEYTPPESHSSNA